MREQRHQPQHQRHRHDPPTKPHTAHPIRGFWRCAARAMLVYVGMLKKIAVAAVLFASACIGDGDDGTAGPVPTEPSPVPGTEAAPPVGSLTRERQPDPETPQPVCDLLPDDDSACAHACDPNALL